MYGTRIFYGYSVADRLRYKPIDIPDIPSSDFLKKKVHATDPTKNKIYDVCRKGCKLFAADEEVCEFCLEKRYRATKRNSDGTEKPIPAATMSYLPLSAQLSTYFVKKETRERLLYRHQYVPTEGFVDVFDGDIYKANRHLFTNEYNVAISLSIDGFVPCNSPGVSLTVVHATILNLPPEERYNLMALFSSISNSW